jgi:hypothetical protein
MGKTRIVVKSAGEQEKGKPKEASNNMDIASLLGTTEEEHWKTYAMLLQDKLKSVHRNGPVKAIRKKSEKPPSEKQKRCQLNFKQKVAEAQEMHGGGQNGLTWKECMSAVYHKAGEKEASAVE